MGYIFEFIALRHYACALPHPWRYFALSPKTSILFSIPLALVVLRPGSPPTLPPESTPPVPRTTYTKIPDRPSRLLRILRSIDLGTTNFDLHLSDSQPSISRWHTDLPLGRALACEFPQPPAQKDAQRCLCSSTRLSRTLPL